MTITKQVAVIISIAVILLGLAGYNFMNAQVWTRPTSQPPQNNVRVPINVGISSTTIQNAVGSLVFNRFAATDAVWSNAYCDSQGQNCQNLGSSATSAINYVQYAKDYCDLNVPNPGSTSLHGVKLAKGGFYDFYDKNGATSIYT